MAERAGAAVDVDLLMRQREIAHRRHRDDSERLVDLEQVDRVLRSSRSFRTAFHRADRSGREILRRSGVSRVRDDCGERRDAAFFGFSARIMTSAAAPSEIELEFAAVTVPPSRNAGFEVGILSGRAFGGCSSVDHAPPSCLTSR